MALISLSCNTKTAPPQGTISGTILLNGTPITSGQVVFSSSALGVNLATNLTYEGNYQFKFPFPPGDYRVYLIPEDQSNIQPGPANEAPPDTLKNVPAKYRNESTTDLKATVVAGPNQKDFDLQK